MVPERLVGREVDGRADVYSLAAVIFESTTGRRPFSSKSWIETCAGASTNHRPTCVTSSPTCLPVSRQCFSRRWIVTRPPPATAGELLARLESAIKSPNGSVERIKSWLEPVKHTRRIGVGAALLVIVGAAEVVWLFEGSGLTLVQHTLRAWFGGG